MQVLQFLIETFAGLVTFVLLLRLVLQWSRADFRNPIARAVLQLSNPVVLPLRRIVPSLGRLDSATALALLLVLTAKLVVLQWLLEGLTITPLHLLVQVVMQLAQSVLHLYLWAIMLHALLSMLAPDSRSAGQSLLYSLCEPALRPIRRKVPTIAGLDLSPLWALIAIQVALIVLR
jgi:YggT family protein